MIPSPRIRPPRPTSATPATPAAPPAGEHHPDAMLQRLRRLPGHDGEVWVFGYASLIWRPEFHVRERHAARVPGWHRALRLRSVVNRGTPERPGLVFALLPGGACRGEVFRLDPARAGDELRQLWAREMPIAGIYTPRWLPCHTARGVLPALAFTLARSHPACVPRLTDAQMLDILRHASGRYGTTLDYLACTADALRARGIRDREIERQLALAARAGRGSQATSAAAARASVMPSSDAASTSTPGSSTSTTAAG